MRYTAKTHYFEHSLSLFTLLPHVLTLYNRQSRPYEYQVILRKYLSRYKPDQSIGMLLLGADTVSNIGNIILQN